VTERVREEEAQVKELVLLGIVAAVTFYFTTPLCVTVGGSTPLAFASFTRAPSCLGFSFSRRTRQVGSQFFCVPVVSRGFRRTHTDLKQG